MLVTLNASVVDEHTMDRTECDPYAQRECAIEKQAKDELRPSGQMVPAPRDFKLGVEEYGFADGNTAIDRSSKEERDQVLVGASNHCREGIHLVA